MKHIHIYISILILSITTSYGQLLKGKVIEKLSDGTEQPLIGASIFWIDTQRGTVTNENGEFSIQKIGHHGNLVISYIGFKADTLHIMKQEYIKVTLNIDGQLDEIFITSSPTSIDELNPIKTEIISSKELLKAACCNLSESFETNASVDVTYSDAVTGTKQIQLLGLDGTYTQIMTENIPNVRGLANNYGLYFIPGSWIQSIDLGKGAGSVLNGYESITGQINVELKKPESSEPLYINLYGNEVGRLEANLNTAYPLSDRWSGGTLLHASHLGNKVDRNDDGFIDMPTFTQFNAIQRFKYEGESLMSQTGVKLLSDERRGGEIDFNRATDIGTTNSYGTEVKTNRIEVFNKTGKLFHEKPYRGLGWINSFTHYNQEAYFGLTNYDGTQVTYYSNLIYQSIIGDTRNTFRTGISFLYDDFDESLNDSSFTRTEVVPGVFYEHTYDNLENLLIVGGLRFDHNSEFGSLITPRLHIKYDATSSLTFRASVGRGTRTPNVIGENLSLLVSSRNIIVEEEIEQEQAWNFGASINKSFSINGKPGSLDFEFFRTQFDNQLIMDRDSDSQLLRFYNLDGKSYANSFKFEVFYEIVKNLDIKAAYKYYDVKSTINGQLLEVPFNSQNRFFVNAGYSMLEDKLKFDLTMNWRSAGRAPTFSDNGLYEAPRDFALLNGQVSYSFSKNFDLYVGGENLTNFKQDNPIISDNAPFAPEFDGTLVWGPVLGRMIYAGIRFSIERKKAADSHEDPHDH